VFLQQLDDGLEEAPKVVVKLPELKELPPKWKSGDGERWLRMGLEWCDSYLLLAHT
ncbi:hypothetical protein A2U01_0071664, partial [Trifolium medium]|nr:hypothetical protein [Trifolium medium]